MDLSCGRLTNQRCPTYTALNMEVTMKELTIAGKIVFTVGRVVERKNAGFILRVLASWDDEWSGQLRSAKIPGL